MEIPISLTRLKNATAILLMLVFLFNVAGYRLFFNYADNQADQSFSAMVDKGQYQSSSLLTFSLPLHMPYLTDKTAERAEGEITINGQIYKYVSRSVRNDSLILQCLPDVSKTAIAEARLHYDNQNTENSLPAKKLPQGARKWSAEPDYDLFESRSENGATASLFSRHFIAFNEPVPSSPGRSLLQPPDCLPASRA